MLCHVKYKFTFTSEEDAGWFLTRLKKVVISSIGGKIIQLSKNCLTVNVEYSCRESMVYSFYRLRELYYEYFTSYKNDPTKERDSSLEAEAEFSMPGRARPLSQTIVDIFNALLRRNLGSREFKLTSDCTLVCSDSGFSTYTSIVVPSFIFWILNSENYARKTQKFSNDLVYELARLYTQYCSTARNDELSIENFILKENSSILELFVSVILGDGFLKPGNSYYNSDMIYLAYYAYRFIKTDTDAYRETERTYQNGPITLCRYDHILIEGIRYIQGFVLFLNSIGYTLDTLIFYAKKFDDRLLIELVGIKEYLNIKSK